MLPLRLRNGAESAVDPSPKVKSPGIDSTSICDMSLVGLSGMLIVRATADAGRSYDSIIMSHPVV